MTDRTSPVRLAEITPDLRAAVAGLEVAPSQRRYVASNARSLADSDGVPGAWARAILAGGEPVGFVLLFDPTQEGAVARGPITTGQLGLWRLMIDRRHQRRGHARGALDLVCDHARERGGFTELLSSCVPGPDGPEAFYLGYGFRPTGRRRNEGREIEIVLPL